MAGAAGAVGTRDRGLIESGGDRDCISSEETVNRSADSTLACRRVVPRVLNSMPPPRAWPHPIPLSEWKLKARVRSGVNRGSQYRCYSDDPWLGKPHILYQPT